jgi:hypothetical protein
MHISLLRPWPAAMTHASLITEDGAYIAALRAWGRHDARRVALAIAWGRYGEADARHELTAALAWHAERARITTVSCRELASAMLTEQMEAIEDRHQAVLSGMIAAADKRLQDNPRDISSAVYAITDMARAEAVPPDFIKAAFNIARWRMRRRA